MTAGPDGVVSERLGNGLRVVIAPRHSSPLVSMAVACRGGGVLEPPRCAGITSLMARTAVKGTATRSAARLAEETEALGGAIAPGASADVCQWSLSLPSRHFARGLELLADVVLEPTFPEPELERERQVALSDLERLRDNMYRYPFRLFAQAAYADHPYGYSVDATERGLTSVGKDDVATWHRRRVLDASPWVFVVGDVDAADAQAAVAATFSGLRFGDEVEPAAPGPWPAGAREQVERRKREQTALVLGFPGPSRGNGDRHALQVLSNALTGLGGRFFDELRERRSLAYTVSAFPVVRWLTGEFVAYIATSPEKEVEARACLIEGFERLAQEGLELDELTRARRYTIGSWHVGGQTNGAHLSRLLDAFLFGSGLDDLLSFESNIEAVDLDAVRDAVARRFDARRIVTGVVRGGPAPA